MIDEAVREFEYVDLLHKSDSKFYHQTVLYH